MGNRKALCSFSRYGWHKGFYNDGDPEEALFEIKYNDFVEAPDDDEFPYDTAHELLCGSCHHFALSLKKVLAYEPYIIESKNGIGFHAFCQIYENRKLYYVDARVYFSLPEVHLHGKTSPGSRRNRSTVTARDSTRF